MALVLTVGAGRSQGLHPFGRQHVQLLKHGLDMASTVHQVSPTHHTAHKVTQAAHTLRVRPSLAPGLATSQGAADDATTGTPLKPHVVSTTATPLPQVRRVRGHPGGAHWDGNWLRPPGVKEHPPDPGPGAGGTERSGGDGHATSWRAAADQYGVHAPELSINNTLSTRAIFLIRVHQQSNTLSSSLLLKPKAEIAREPPVQPNRHPIPQNLGVWCREVLQQGVVPGVAPRTGPRLRLGTRA